MVELSGSRKLLLPNFTHPVDNAIWLKFLVVEISCFQTILVRWIALSRVSVFEICLPKEHLGVVKNSLKRVRAFQIELEFESVGFLRRGENRSTRRKTSPSKGENQQQTQPTYGVDARIRTGATLVGGECSHHCATLAPQYLLVEQKILN